jgi:hypothetical protein
MGRRRFLGLRLMRLAALPDGRLSDRLLARSLRLGRPTAPSRREHQLPDERQHDQISQNAAHSLLYARLGPIVGRELFGPVFSRLEPFNSSLIVAEAVEIANPKIVDIRTHSTYDSSVRWLRSIRCERIAMSSTPDETLDQNPEIPRLGALLQRVLERRGIVAGSDSDAYARPAVRSTVCSTRPRQFEIRHRTLLR